MNSANELEATVLENTMFIKILSIAQHLFYFFPIFQLQVSLTFLLVFHLYLFLQLFLYLFIQSSPGGVLAFLASVIAMISKIRKMRVSDDSTDTEGEPDTELLDRIIALEDRFKSFQEVLIDDSAYAGSSDVTDLTSWLGQMETKIAGHSLEPSVVEESDVGSEKPESQKPEKAEERRESLKPKEEVEERFEEEQGIIQTIEEILTEPTEISSQMLLSAPELQATNERLKALAHNLNDQLHSLRDKVFLLDHELKRMAKGVEFALMRAKFAGANEMVSFFTFHLFQMG